MATWTKEQVARVARLRVTVRVDAELVVRDRDDAVVAAAKERLAGQLGEMAHAFGVDTSAEDLEFVAVDEPNVPHSFRLDCRWNPSTNAAELRGGPLDGRVYAVRRIGDPIEVPVMAESPWLESEHSSEAYLSPARLMYEFTGEWDETDRRWVYALR